LYFLIDYANNSGLITSNVQQQIKNTYSMSISTERSAPSVHTDLPASFLTHLKEQQGLQVKELIKNQTLITIEPNRTIDRALMIMVNQGKKHLPVVTVSTLILQTNKLETYRRA
jgi:CBS domain-containing protein